MANGLDVVAVGVEPKGTVIIGVIVRPQSRRTVVFAASLERRCVEGVNGIAILGHEGEVHTSLDGFTAADPELRPSLGAKARVACATRLLGGDLHHEVIAQRRQSHEIEGFRALVVGYWNANVVEHGMDPSLHTPCLSQSRPARASPKRHLHAGS